MKVLIVHSCYQHRGGEDTVVEQEFDLLRSVYDVQVLYFQNKSGIKGAFQFLFAVWNLFAARKLRGVLNEFQPDVVHVHNWHFATGPIVFRVCKHMNIPVVHTLHNYRLLCPSALLFHNNQVFTASLHESFPWTAIRKKVYRNSYLLTFWLAFIVWMHKITGTWKMVDKYICLTSFARQLFHSNKLGIPDDHFFVKGNFTTDQHPDFLPREKGYLYIGRLSEEKGILLLLDAFKKLPFELKIAGSGPLEEIVMDVSLAYKNIAFLGSLGRDELNNYLKTCEALLLPSICYETFGMALIEAFSNGTTVIASDIGAISVLVKDNINGLLVEKGSVLSLEYAVREWEAMPELQKEQMRKNAYMDFRAHYSSEQQLFLFNELYQSIGKHLQADYHV